MGNLLWKTELGEKPADFTAASCTQRGFPCISRSFMYANSRELAVSCTTSKLSGAAILQTPLIQALQVALNALNRSILYAAL